MKSVVEYVEEDRGYKTKCWIWQRCLSPQGYGAVGRSKGSTAHRYMYEKLVGPVPDGLTLDHLCRVRPCVNPEHLEPVTNAVNSRRGMRAKLKPEQVIQIRAKRVDERLSCAALGREFGVCRETIRQICAGERWAVA